jgi:threonine dehydratase
MEIYCKLDNLQRTGSFKERGARNALAQLPSEQQQRGVIAASAGNHAQALAYQGKLLGIPATVVMPKFAPLIKVSNCRKLGATVVMHGAHFGEPRRTRTRSRRRKASLTSMATTIRDHRRPGHDGDRDRRAGAGSRCGDRAGGWRRLAGGRGARRENDEAEGADRGGGSRPCRELFGGAPSGRTGPHRHQATLADGLAIPQVGTNAFNIAKDLVDRCVVVSEEQIAVSILRIVEVEKTVVEGSAATPLAACLSGQLPELAGKKVVLLLCGGNIDPNVLSRVVERGLVSDGRLARFTAVISDRPGGLADLTAQIASAGASIKQVVHDRAFAGSDVSAVHVLCTVETRDHQHLAELRLRLKEHGVPTFDPR